MAMTIRRLPPAKDTRILFAHPAYQLGEALHACRPDLQWTIARDTEAMLAMAGNANVMVLSGFWRDALLERAPQLTFIQSISAGINQYPLEALRARGIRLASAQGANTGAVVEHALSLMLALSRHLHLGRDRQAKAKWRPMISNPLKRERELAGLTLMIVGLGGIGRRLAGIAKALGMRVMATKRDPRIDNASADKVVASDELLAVLPEADYVVLTCPLTPETTGLINATALAAMKPGVVLINVARGKVVVEEALIEALRSGHVSAAGLDCVEIEPLPAESPLWGFENVLITPHSAGETQAYEANIIDLLLTNLERLWRGETDLRNGVI